MDLNLEIFTPEWIAMLAPTAEAAMAADIKVYVVGDREYNPEDHEYTVEETTYYTGKARIQPIRMEVQTHLTGNPTSIQNIRVQIPIADNFDIRMGMKMRVTKAPLNPVLKNYIYEISKVMDSSNPFERTFQCQIDQEVRDNG